MGMFNQQLIHKIANPTSTDFDFIRIKNSLEFMRFLDVLAVACGYYDT